MRRRLRFLRALGPTLLLAVGGAYALASWNWCPPSEARPPSIENSGLAVGALKAGAARAEIRPPYPVVAAGYAPPRPELSTALPALRARAVVLEVAPVRVGIVSLDALSASDGVVQGIREASAGLGLSDVWVFATHTHSGMGGYDRRFVAQLAGIGGFREEAKQALVEAASSALREASARLEPATLQSGQSEVPALVRARSGDAADARLTRLVFQGDSRQIAELWIWSAHPTLVDRPASALSPDFPGALDDEEVPVVLLQGAVGNASAVVPEGEGAAPQRYARALEVAGRSTPLLPASQSLLGASRVRVGLPRPDASRLVPGAVRAAGDNLLCGSAADEAEIAALRLGPLTLVAIPAEASLAAARRLEERANATRVLSMANGYLGYVEPEAIAHSGGGESKRQYYAPALLERLEAGATLAVEALTPNPR